MRDRAGGIECLWQPGLLLGIGHIDDEHREIYAAMAALAAQDRSAAASIWIGGTLAQLRDLVRAHFVAEEDFMHAMVYPDLASHVQVHADFLTDMDRALQEFESLGRLPIGFLRFLVNWWSAHIQGIDRRYAEWHAAHPIASGRS